MQLEEKRLNQSITHLDKERLNFAASVTLYWTLVHMESTIQIDPESGRLMKSETVLAKDIICSVW
jgi:hypothetical protein